MARVEVPGVAVRAVAAILLGVALLWAAYSLGRSQGTYELADQGYSKKEAATASSQIRAECAGLGGAAHAKCRDEIVNAAEQRTYDEQNLDAQRKVADRTTWFIVLGAVELALTAWGILVLRDQLRANRSANEIATSGTRPYLLFSEPYAERAYTAGGHQVWAIFFKAINNGGPAVIESCLIGRDYRRSGPPDYDSLSLTSTSQEGLVVGRGAEFLCKTEVSEGTMFRSGSEPLRRMSVAALVRVVYRGVGDDPKNPGHTSEQGRMVMFLHVPREDIGTEVISMNASNHRRDKTT